MIIIRRIINKLNNIRIERFIRKQSLRLSALIKSKHSNSCIYLFCSPTHSNLGDQAQLMCWLRLFKEWYPQHKVICIPTRFRDFDTLRSVRSVIKPEDKIFIHSGYLIFDPHPELPFIIDVVRAFYDYPITILPQTVNLMDEWFRHIVSQQFNAHPNLTLICRDEVSYKISEDLFPKIHLKLMPDVVTSLIGDTNFEFNSYKRNGVLLCVRNDGEKFYTAKQINCLKNKFKNIRVTQTDTTINEPMWKWEKEREKLIRGIIDLFSQYQVIITDRYHGTIFSQIANTPVIVIASSDHKLSSGVKWFPKNVYGKMVQYAQNLDESYTLAIELIKNPLNTINTPYFKNNYYKSKM